MLPGNEFHCRGLCCIGVAMADDHEPCVPGAAPADPRRAVTSYDIAALAGISQSAVSRALTPGGSVSRATRARIMIAIARAHSGRPQRYCR
jgi:hypothetical protein